MPVENLSPAWGCQQDNRSDLQPSRSIVDTCISIRTILCYNAPNVSTIVLR